MLYVIMGRQGSGKTTLKNKLIENGISPITTTTTRDIRPGETNGVDYNFVSDEEFDRMIGNEEMLEFIELNGNRYGTPVKALSVVAFNPDKDYAIVVDPVGMSRLFNLSKVMEIVLCPIEVCASDRVRLERITKRTEDFNEEKFKAREAEEDLLFSAKKLKNLDLLAGPSINESRFERINSDQLSEDAMAAIALNLGAQRSTLLDDLARIKAEVAPMIINV